MIYWIRFSALEIVFLSRRNEICKKRNEFLVEGWKGRQVERLGKQGTKWDKVKNQRWKKKTKAI